MANGQYPLKNVRLQQLSDAGFNVADFICFEPHVLKHGRGELETFLKKHGRISCRHFHADESKYFKCPVLYDQSDIESVLAFCLANNEGGNEAKVAYYTLCNQALTLSDSIYAGNILIRSDREYAIEFFKGKGTPRDLEAKNADEIVYFEREFGKPMPSNVPGEIQLLRTSLNRFAETLEIRPVIIEFSIYPYPVGRNQSHAICWEWRQGWLHYAMQHNKHLVAENQSLLAEIRRLRMRITKLKTEQDEAHDLLRGGQ